MMAILRPPVRRARSKAPNLEHMIEGYRLPVGLVLLGVFAALAAGCGGGDSSDRATAPPEKPTLVAALGDSLTAGAPRWDPNPSNRRKLPATALNPKNQFGYWGERASGGRLRFRNCGVWGEVTAQIARRLDRCAKGAQQLIVQGGGNDITRKRGVAGAARNLERMVRRGKKLGLKVMIGNVPPFGGRRSRIRQTRRLNRIIRAIGERQHVRVLDFHEILEDPGNPGAYDPQLTEDYIHPSVRGAERLGDLFRVPGRSQGVED